jgi:hypothetical protein
MTTVFATLVGEAVQRGPATVARLCPREIGGLATSLAVEYIAWLRAVQVTDETAGPSTARGLRDVMRSGSGGSALMRSSGWPSR